MEATIGMTRVDCTVLFCDIANFDEVCGNLCAHDVLRKLSEVLGKIADVIEANNGTLLEFIGDEVMAVFNAPNSMRLHPKVGVQAGVQIHEAIEMIAPQKSSDGKEIVVKCQVGVHSARILAGNVGSPQRMKYGLLGDGVNLSARLKGLNSKYGTKTLVTHQVLEEIQQFEDFNQAFVSRPIDVVAVKGRKEPTTVHEVFCSLRRDKDTADLEMLVASHEEAFRLYHQRLFKDALKVFSEVTKGFEQGGYGRDEPSRQLAGRCHAYIAQPPPLDWDGVERLKAKHFQIPQEPLHEDAKPEVLKDNGDDNVRPMTTYTSDSVRAEASITLIQPNFSPPAPHLSEALVYKSFEEIEELDLAEVEADS
jgi:adenylate cyclase